MIIFNKISKFKNNKYKSKHRILNSLTTILKIISQTLYYLKNLNKMKLYHKIKQIKAKKLIKMKQKKKINRIHSKTNLKKCC